MSSRPSRVNPPTPFGNMSGGTSGSTGRRKWHGRRRARRRHGPGIVMLLEVRAQIADVIAQTARALASTPARRSRPTDRSAGGTRRPVNPFHERHGPDSMSSARCGVHLVEITDRNLVEHHDVRSEALEPPVFLRLQHLPDEVEIVAPDEPHGHNRQVAGDAERPQPGLSQPVGRELGRRRAQRTIQADARVDASRSNIIASAAVDVEGRQGVLRVREGQRQRSRGRSRVVIPARQRFGALAIAGDAQRETQSHHGAGRQTHALPQTQDRIEHDAVRERQRTAVECGRSCTVRPRPRNAARSVSHSTGPGTARRAPSTWTAHTDGSRCALPPVTSRRVLAGRYLGLEKQLAERRVRKVVGGWRQHDLHVARDFELARARSPWFVSVSRRTSTSSSVETATSSAVVRSPSRRWIDTRSERQVTR